MPQRVQLLLVDPELGEGVPPEDRPHATHAVVAETWSLERGPLAGRADVRGDVTLLVLGGVVMREVCLGERRSAELFGRGDLMRLATAIGDGLVPHDVRWTVVEAARVAALDGRFARTARPWPAISTTIGDRLFAQADRAAVHLAIAQLPRVEQRVLAILWHLAERFGRVTPGGVLVPLKLTHESLGRLVGAQRPTVTLALAELHEAGALTRAIGGGWLLDPLSANALEPVTGLADASPPQFAADGKPAARAGAAPGRRFGGRAPAAIDPG